MMRANKITNNGEVLLDLTQDTATPETVGEGVTFHTADGSPAVGTAKLGGAELNIAYGDEPPEDTSKLWVKTSEPNEVLMTTASFETQTTSEYSFEKMSANLPNRMQKTCACAVGDKIYLFGGQQEDGSNAKPLNTIYCYDTVEDKITTLSITMPSAITQMIGITYGTKIYLLGGYTGSGNNMYSSASKNIYCFDTEEMTIEPITATLTMTHSSSVYMKGGAIGSKLYIMYCGNNYGKLFCFDAEVEVVTEIATYYTNVMSTSRLLSDGKRFLYVLCGYTSASPTIYWDEIARIDTVDFSMSVLDQKLLEGMTAALCEFVDDTIFIFSGNAKSIINYGQLINLRLGTVSKIPKEDIASDLGMSGSPVLYGGTAISLGSKVYLFGGYKSNSLTSGNGVLDIVCFTTQAQELLLEADTMKIVPDKSQSNPFFVVNGDKTKVEFFVKEVYKGNADGIAEPVESALYKDGAWTNI